MIRILESLPVMVGNIFLFFLGWELVFNNFILMSVEIGSVNQHSESIFVNAYLFCSTFGKIVGSPLSPALYDVGSFSLVALVTFVSAVGGMALLAGWLVYMRSSRSLSS